MSYAEIKAQYLGAKALIDEMAVHAANHLSNGERSTIISWRESKTAS